LVGHADFTHPAKPTFNVAQHEAAIYEKSGHRMALEEACPMPAMLGEDHGRKWEMDCSSGI
jgi:hypothetical protein